MDGFSSQSSGGFEDRIRQMLAGGAGPRVRLPPLEAVQQQPSPNGQPLHQHNQSWNGAYRQNPVAPQSHPPYPRETAQRLPPSQAAPPHFRNRMNGQPELPPQPIPTQQGPFPLNRPHRGNAAPRQGRNQQIQLDPDAYQRGGTPYRQLRQNPPRNLYNPNARLSQTPLMRADAQELQAQYLERVAMTEYSKIDMGSEERREKDAFRLTLEKLCHEVCDANPKLPKVKLACFGSFASGFASKGSDMDLVIVVQDQSASSATFSLLEDDLPRALEKRLLQAGHGARLLTRTRVPIIKVCQDPGSSLLSKLEAERERWDFQPNEKKYPHMFPNDGEQEIDEDNPPANTVVQAMEETAVTRDETVKATTVTPASTNAPPSDHPASTTALPSLSIQPVIATDNLGRESPKQRRDHTRTWTRERKAGPLDFPKDGIGIQCDINFFNPLGLHNTHMLRCYSLCDPRVRPIVLSVKSWAKLRRINSSYSGTLSSYGYVLMVLHYLMNVAQPPVLPNLQSPWRPTGRYAPAGFNKTEIDGWTVDFWRNEDEIQAAVQNGQMSSNRESVGSLLVGFFQYYSSQINGSQFRWTNWILSLRTPGGIMTKDSKGWVKATTEEGEGKKIQHRYLFCIEDPFELSHNVARTVTHNGIVAIRDEFRRAYRILTSIGRGEVSREGELFEALFEPEDMIDATAALKLGVGLMPAKPVEQRTIPAEQRPDPAKQQQRGFDATANRQRPPQQAKRIDLADQEAFPTLGSAKTAKPNWRRKSPRQSQKLPDDENMLSIDGDKAKAYLEEFRRKKAEAQTEHLANGIAESVLDGED